LRQFSMLYRLILLSTLALTVVFDLTVAVEVGLALSSLFFIYRVSSLTKVEAMKLPPERARLADGRTVGAWQLFGSIFFGSVTKLEALVDPAHPLPDVVILEMGKVINLDTSGLDALESLHYALEKRGGRLLLAALNEQPRSLLSRSHFVDRLGRDNGFADFDAALNALMGSDYISGSGQNPGRSPTNAAPGTVPGFEPEM
jgi:sulfate permease, SulP family